MTPTESEVIIDYTNHAKIRAKRRILPTFIWFGKSPYHPEAEAQWYMRAYDFQKAAPRDFAIRDIHEWIPAEEYQP